MPSPSMDSEFSGGGALATRAVTTLQVILMHNKGGESL